MNTGVIRAIACTTKAVANGGSSRPALNALGNILAFSAKDLQSESPAGGGIFAAPTNACPILPKPALDTGWWTIDQRPGWGAFVEISTQTGAVFLGLADYDDGGEPIWQYGLLAPNPNGAPGFSGNLQQPVSDGLDSVLALGNVSLTPVNTALASLNLPQNLGGGTLTLRRYSFGPTLLPADPRIRLESGWWWSPDQPGIGLPLEIQGSQVYFAQLARTGTGSAIWRSALFSTLFTNAAASFTEVRGGSSFLNTRSGGFSFTNPQAFRLDTYASSTARFIQANGPLAIKRFDLF